MAVTYEWTWGPMRVEKNDQFSDVVTGIAWICLAYDKAVNPDVHGKESGLMPAPAADPSNYIPVNVLSIDTVQSWIDSGIDKAAIEAVCLGYLNNQLSPAVRNLDMPVAVPVEPTDP